MESPITATRGATPVVLVRPVAASQVIEPCWKSLRRPPGTSYSSLVGYPRTESCQPIDAHLSRIAPRTACAPALGDQ